MAYSKMSLYDELLASDLPDDPYLRHDLEQYFPAPLPERYAAQMRQHRLRREIIATVVANQLVDRAGTTFTFRLGEETGASPAQLARAHAVAVEVFSMRDFWAAVESLDNRVAAASQMSMLIEGRRLVERAARWLVQAHPGRIEIPELVTRYGAGAVLLAANIPTLLDEEGKGLYDQWAGEFMSAGVPEELAAQNRFAAGAALDVRHRRGGSEHRPRPGDRDAHELRGRIAAAAQLAAQPHPRATAQRPLAGARPRGAARRPRQPGRRAGGRGDRGRRRRRVQRAGFRGLGGRAATRSNDASVCCPTSARLARTTRPRSRSPCGRSATWLGSSPNGGPARSADSAPVRLVDDRAFGRRHPADHGCVQEHLQVVAPRVPKQLRPRAQLDLHGARGAAGTE